MTRLLKWIGIGVVVYVGLLLLALCAAFLDIKELVFVVALCMVAVKIVLAGAGLYWLVGLLFKLSEWVDRKI